MMLKEIIGHKQLVRFLLKNLKNQQMAHAYIFQGPVGIGKRVVAQAFAQAFLCLLPREDGDACQSCQACYLFQAGTHPEFIQIQPEGNSIKIEQVRQLQQTLTLKPVLERGRVVLIQQADGMTEESANSLLKILEEPPERTVFLLLTDRPFALLETIRSRCQTLQFYPLNNEEMREFAGKVMPEGWQGEIETLLLLAEGIPGKLEEFLQEKGLALTRQQVITGLKDILAQGVSCCFRQAEEWEKEKELLSVKLEILLSIFRDLLVHELAAENQLTLNRDCEPLLKEMKQRLQREQILVITDSILKAQRLLTTNVNIRLLLEWLFLQIARYGG
ncbi:DNA polymerase-3 subunit delta' [Carboxydocella thermautotrophica]|nr:DNA polymerase-3 subunit delta' [Carboxydocella thermautotrophica]